MFYLPNLGFSLKALEIQGVGYLSAQLSLKLETQLIVTNWGSDNYYFRNIVTDAAPTRNLIRKTDRYSTECVRDYDFAREMGFRDWNFLLSLIPEATRSQVLNLLVEKNF